MLFTTDLGARGIDIEGLDWIIHFDPPKNIETFIHRSGRTARAGLDGSCLLFLQEHERDFLKLLSMRKLEAKEYEGDEVEERKVTKITKRLLEDRSDYNRASSAFIAHVRSYKELDLKYVFKFSKLDPQDLALAYSLP